MYGLYVWYVCMVCMVLEIKVVMMVMVIDRDVDTSSYNRHELVRAEAWLI
jgi:hypothetical protein